MENRKNVIFKKSFYVIIITLICSCLESNNNEYESERILNVMDDKIFIYGNAWGLGGNHQKIIISADEIKDSRSYNKDDVYIVYVKEIYYKIVENDLYIYASESQTKEPTIFESDVNIKFIGLSSADELKYYSDNYQKEGIKKFSIW